MTDLVAVDIGGTHARFVIASVAEDGSISLGEPETLHTKDHASFQTAWEDFRERCGGALPPRAAPGVGRGVTPGVGVGKLGSPETVAVPGFGVAHGTRSTHHLQTRAGQRVCALPNTSPACQY